LSDQEPLPDFYAILQVHPTAEPEIIEVAYRRLMRKYHPDALSPETKSDPELISRVRWINVAYDVLSDPVQRAAYDESIATQSSDQAQKIDSEIETRICHIRCAKTRQEYRMLLGRRPGVSDRFTVLGFEPLASATPRLALPQESTHFIPAPPEKWIDRLKARLRSGEEKTIQATEPPPRFPSPTEINDLFNEDPLLDFSKIDFGNHRCPGCDGEFTYPNGKISHWGYCNVCGHIYCSGDFMIIPITPQSPPFSRCPWCRRAGTVRVRPLEEREVLRVKGAYGRSSPAGSKQARLSDPGKRSLPGK
jgi:hypothetical protein